MHWFLSQPGQSFHDRDAAQIKRDRLRSELGPQVELEVRPHPDGGYAVSCEERTSVPEADAGCRAPSSATWDGQAASITSPVSSTLATRAISASSSRANTEPRRQYRDTFALRPAVRAFLAEHLTPLFGLCLIWRPEHLLSLLRLAEQSEWAGLARAGLMLVGALFAVISASRVVGGYLANRYLIDPEGVAWVRWYSERGRLRRRTPPDQLRTVYE